MGAAQTSLIIESAMAQPFRIYALCCVVLGVKILASAVYTGMKRQKVGSSINAGDAKVFGIQGATTKVDEAPEVDRAIRIQRNDSENIPLFFAVGLVYVLTGASLIGTVLLCGTFTVARVMHTIAYMGGLQPLRAVCFLVGAVCTLLMIFRIVVNVL